MARDSTQHKVRASLKQAGIKSFKYTKDIGRALLFDSLPNQFTESLPTFSSIYQTGSDTAAALSSFAASRTDTLKHGIDKFFGNEAVASVRSQAKTLIKQVKSGSLYTPSKDDDLFGSLNDDLLDNFGGVDMNYDDEGEYVDVSSTESGQNVNIAAAQNKADNERTQAMMSAIGSSTEAQMKWSQTLTQASLQVQAKFHDETLSAMRNQLTVSSAIYETMNTRLSEMQTMLTEANRSLVTDVSEIKGYLKTISQSYTTKNKYVRQEDKNPLANGFSIQSYIDQVKKNFNDSELGMITTMLPMLATMSDMDFRKKKNPILYLTDAIASAFVPKKTKNRMEKTDKVMNSFVDALLAKLADMDNGNSLFGRIFGYKPDMKTTIKTARDLNYATQWTGKDSKALTDVIPTQLAQIISLMSGQPIQLFDYKTGTFKNSYQAAGRAYRDIHQYKPYSESINTLRGRAEKIDFGTDRDNEEFRNYVELFLNRAISEGGNINPYKSGFNPLAGTGAKSEYSTALIGLLKSLGKGGLIELGSDVINARKDKTEAASSVNSQLVESSMIMAFSQIGMAGLDESGQDKLLNRILTRVKDKDKSISSREIMRMMRQARSSAAKTGPNSVQSMLRDIRNIIRRGIITYSYGISNGGSSTPVPPGFDDALKDARAARRTITRKTQYTDTTRRIGGITYAERQSILRDVRIGKPSKAKLEEYAEKLGYGSVNELIDKANSEGPGVGGDSIQYRPGMTSEQIAREMRNRELIDESGAAFESFANRHFSEATNERIGGFKSSMDRFRSRISAKVDKLRSPFKLVDYALESLDGAMFKILYGDIPDEDKEDEKSVMDLIRAALEKQTNRFGDFLNEKLDFIDDKLFGKDGVFKKAAQWVANKLVGTRGEDGQFSGGKFSNLANKAVAAGKSGASSWFEAMKEQLIGTKSGASKRVRGFDGQWKTVDVGYEGGLLQPLRDKVQDIKVWLFGKDNEMTDSKELASKLGKELKDAAPSMGKGAAIGAGTWLASGLLTGMFLPGGPLLSGLVGSTVGLIQKSDKLREYLFGKEDEKGKRSGGLFSDKVYKGLTKYIPTIAKGAGIGATLGNLGLLPFGLGNMAGLAFGALGGIVKSSDELRTFMFGTDDDPDSGLINKKLRTKLMDMIPGWLIGKTAGNVAWNTITSLGLIPGLAMLPGGPILGAMGGLVGAFSKEHIEAFLFGKKDKDGKRDDSGIFSKAFGALKDRVMSPLAEKINKIGDNIGGWFKEVVTENLKDFFSPVTELFKRGLNKMKKKSMDITDIMRGAFATVIDKTLGRFFRFIGRKLFGKKGEDGKRSGGIIRKVASLPFQALGGIGRKLSKGIDWADRRFEAKEYRRYQKQLKKDKKAGTAWQDEAGNWHVADEEAFNAEAQERRERRGTGGNFWDTVETFRQRGQKARETADERAERYRKEREAKEKAKQQADATAEAINPQIETVSGGIDRTNSLLEDILKALGGTRSSGSSAGSGSTAGAATATASGPNTILADAANAVRSGIDDIIGEKSPEEIKGEYLQQLYERADRAMSSSSDPRKTADEIIANLPAEYASEGIEVVNRVYELNYGPNGAKLGGSNGKTTGLWETVTGLLGGLTNGLTNGGGWLSTLSSYASQLLSGGGLGSLFSAGGLAAGAKGLSTALSSGASSAASAAASSGAKKGIISSITSALKNPKTLAKGGLLAGAAVLGLSALGAMQNSNEEEQSFGSNLMTGAKSALSGLTDWYTSSEGIMSTMATTVKKGKEKVLNNSLLAGVGSLTPTEIVKAWKGEAIDVGESLAKTVGENNIQRIKSGVTAVKSGASKVASTATELASKVGDTAIGQNLTKVAKAVRDKIVAAAKTFFNSKAVQALMGALGKSASKIPTAIGNVLDNALVNALKGAAKKVGSTAATLAAKAASTVGTGGLMLIAFGIADFMSGMSDANKYFRVRESEDTIGMKVVSGIVKCLQGLISNLLASTGAGILGSIAVSLIDTGWIAQMLYKKIVGEEGEQELAEKQAALEADCAKYNEENGTNLTVEEYSEQVDSGGIVKTVKSAFSSVASGVKNFATSVKDTAVNLFSGAKNAIVNGAKSLFSSNASKSEEGLTTEETGTKSIASKAVKAMSTLVTSALNTIFKLNFVKSIIGDRGSEITKMIEEALDRVAANMSNKSVFQVVLDKALAVPKAVTAFYSGYRNPSKYLDVDGEDMTDRQSIAAGIGAAIASITSGAIRGKDVATKVNDILESARARSESKKNTKLTSSMSTSATKISSLSSTESSSSDSVDVEDDSDKPTGKTAGVFSTIKNAVTSAFSKFTSWLTGKGRGRGRFGRGEYFSQTDPRWNRYDPDMSESGCGPTVAAMMASHYGKGRWGRSANPIEADYMSRNMPGMRDSDGGTNPKFFEEYGASKGINMKAGAPNNRAIESNLRSGNAVGLMGEGGAFGSNMHYMMADGIDRNGNVNIVDPYGGQAKKQLLSSITKNIDIAIYSNGSVGASNLAADGYPMEEGSPVGMGRGRYGRSKQSNTANLTARRAVNLHGDRNAQSKASLVNKYAGAVANEKDIKPIEGSAGGFGRGRWGRGGDTANGMVYYNQADSRWASHTTGGSSTIGAAGCCISSVAMCVSTLAGKAITPDQIVDTYKSKVGILTGGSMVWSAQNSLAALFGGEVTSLSSKDQIIAALKAGKPVVIYGEKTACPACDYTDSGSRSGPHCVVLASIDSSGKLHINDPGKRERINKTFSTDVIRGFSQAWAWSKGGKGIVGSSGTAAGSQADDIVAVAKAEIGYKEKASNASLDDKTANAGSGNYTKYGRDLGNQTGPGWPWCHQFVSWCAKKAGCENIIPITASCATGVSWFNQKGQYHKKSGYTPKKGDIIYFGSGGGDHVGIVTDCDGKYVYTIEGNTGSQGSSSVIAEGNAVCDKKYPLDLARIDGYGSPSYGGSTGIAGNSSGESGNEYSGVFGAFQKVFDQVQSELDKIFAPLTGSSTTDSTGTTSSTSSGTVGSVSSDSGGSLSGGSTFPTYTLSDSDKKFIAGVSSQEQNESDIAAQRLEVSQMANLNEVEYKRGTTGSDLLSTLKGNWYAQTSVNRGYRGDYSPQAMQAVEEVLVQGKRTLPRHVTEHDYYGDISNIDLNPSTETGKQNRLNMKPGDTIKNTMGSTYQFYKFAGKDGASGSGDPFGSKSQYIKSPYTEDIPWGSGRGGRGSSPSEIYRTGGIQNQIREMNDSMAKARADDNIYRKMDAVDTQAKAMQKAASSGAYGRGEDSAAVKQIASAMIQVVELLTEIRDQNAAVSTAATKTTGNGYNPLSSQTKLDKNDPGTSSMRKMAIRS